MAKKGQRLVQNPLILAVGDVHGNWDLLARQMEITQRTFGRIDGAILVGDVEANRGEEDLCGVSGPSKYRKVGSFPKILSSEIKLPAPVWFIGGNHEPWPTYDALGAGLWGPGVTYLGRAGVAEILGLRVAFLSGIYSPRVFEGSANKRISIKDRTYWVRAELEKVMKAAKDGRVDILVTHDWPACAGLIDRVPQRGGDDLEALCRRLRPTAMICGHMHHRMSFEIGDSRVEALGHIRSGGDGSAVLEWGKDGLVIYPPLPIAALPREI